MRLLRKVFISLSAILFVVCCGVVLLFNWSALGWKALTVPTGSMRPTIPPGSLVLMHRVPARSLKVGDVITYANPNKMNSTITHRIIKTYKIDDKIPAFITRGDANPSPDAPIVEGLVKGRAVWHVPYVGSLLSWGKGILGLTILVYIPALLIMIDETKRLSEYYRSIKHYRLRGYELAKQSSSLFKKLALSLKLSVLIVIVMGVVGTPVKALLNSNTVALSPNIIKVKKIKHCSEGNDNNINVTNTTDQSSSTGNASNSVGNASSGNASNSSNSNINITITNC